jgi:hypothetical protein
MVFAHDPAGQVGVYFDDVDATPSELFPSMRTRFNLGSEGLDAAQRAIVLQIFRSIRFEEF